MRECKPNAVNIAIAFSAITAAFSAFISHELYVLIGDLRHLEMQLETCKRGRGNQDEAVPCTANISSSPQPSANVHGRALSLNWDAELLRELHDELCVNGPDLAQFKTPQLVTTRKSKSKRESKARAVDIFVRFHNAMWKSGHLPLSRHGIGRSSFDMYDSMPALGYRAFYKRHVHRIPAGSRCLGFALNDREKSFFPACNADDWWSVKFTRETIRAYPDSRVLSADITQVTATNLPAILASSFDVVQCHEVFEHVANPFSAAVGLMHLLKPGGLIFFNAPFSIHMHGKSHDTSAGEAFGDHFRYTLEGAKRVFLEAGFEVVASEMTGNAMLAVGQLMGFGKDDFSGTDLAAALDATDGCGAFPFCQDSSKYLVPVGSALVLRKPMLTSTRSVNRSSGLGTPENTPSIAAGTHKLATFHEIVTSCTRPISNRIKVQSRWQCQESCLTLFNCAGFAIQSKQGVKGLICSFYAQCDSPKPGHCMKKAKKCFRMKNLTAD